MRVCAYTDICNIHLSTYAMYASDSTCIYAMCIYACLHTCVAILDIVWTLFPHMMPGTFKGYTIRFHVIAFSKLPGAYMFCHTDVENPFFPYWKNRPT